MKTSDIEVSYIQHCGDDLAVVNAARVSFHKESEWDYDPEDGEWNSLTKKCLGEKDIKLINYLARNKHFSPFNHSFITLRVKAPIFVARQLVKHKFMPWNEVSRRYVDDEVEVYYPNKWRMRADNVKQGSSEEVFINGNVFMKIDDALESAVGAYTEALAKGMAPEQARMILPQNMMTEWWWSGTLNAYCDMLRLRLDPHTQYESRIVANKVKEIIQPLFPVSLNALLEVK